MREILTLSIGNLCKLSRVGDWRFNEDKSFSFVSYLLHPPSLPPASLLLLLLALLLSQNKFSDTVTKLFLTWDVVPILGNDITGDTHAH